MRAAAPRCCFVAFAFEMAAHAQSCATFMTIPAITMAKQAKKTLSFRYETLGREGACARRIFSAWSMHN